MRHVTPVPLGPGIRAAFTDRRGGVSAPPYDGLNLSEAVGDDPRAVVENRRRAAHALGVDPTRVAWMRQVHGRAVVEMAAPGTTPTADAMVTSVAGLALAVLVADCVPVLLADADAGVVAVAHAGRRGAAAGIASAVVAAMKDLGARRITAACGPAICGACYEVPAAVRDAVSITLPAARHVTRRGNPGLDLRAGLREQLARAGVTNVWCDPRCTMEAPELFSYRRDGRTGRFAGYVWRER